MNLEVRERSGATLLHLAAERGNTVFWNLLYPRDDVDKMALDLAGNTPLMAAAAAGQAEIVAAWVKQVKLVTNLPLVLTLSNQEGSNLAMLVVKNLPEVVVEAFIDAVDLSSCIDQKDKQGFNLLLHLSALEKWNLVKRLLSNKNLDEVAIDIHPTDKLGNSALVLTLLARVNAERQVQNFKVKKDLGGEKGWQKQKEQLESIVELLVNKERDLHGLNLTTGRDTGIKCLREQMEGNRKLRTPVPEEVIQAFTNLYNVVFKPKKKPAPVPEPAKVETKKLQVSSFQQRMNEIYKDAKRDEFKKKEEMESLRLKPAPPKTPEVRMNFDDIEYDLDEESPNQNGKHEANIKETNGFAEHLDIPEPKPVVEEPAGESEPSVEEIRAMWKQNKAKTEPEKVEPEEEFNSNKFFESLLQKHENAKSTETPLAVEESEDQDLVERMNEEIVWALQQKQEAERLSNPQPVKTEPVKPEPAKPDLFKDWSAPLSAQTKQSDVSKTAEKKVLEPSKPEVKHDAQSLIKLLDKPRKLTERQLKLQQEREKQQQEQELKELENAINEEIRWALEEKKRLEEERSRRLAGTETIVPETADREEEWEWEEEEKKRKEEEERKKKEEEERKRKASVERMRLENLQKEAEELIRRAKEQQKLEQVSKAADNAADLANGIDEEIKWAMEEKSRVEEEKKIQLPPSPKPKIVEEKKEKEEQFSPFNLKSVRESAPKPQTIQEKIEQQKKKEEERFKKFQEEKARILNQAKSNSSELGRDGAATKPSKPESNKINSTDGEAKTSNQPEPTNGKDTKNINGIEIINNSEEKTSDPSNLPRWKREKMLRENRTKSLDAPEPLQTARKGSLGSSDPAPSPDINDPAFLNLPRWKREKLIRLEKTFYVYLSELIK